MHEQVQTLVDAGRLDSEIGERVSALEPGVFCLHKSWGSGVVREWDLFGDKMTIDFEGKPGHAMKLQFAANSLEILDDGHIFAQFVRSPEAVRQQALDEPVVFAKQVLQSFGGSMLLDRWEDIVKGRIVPEAKYRSWWESAKKAIRSDRSFVLPPKRNVPFELRDEGVSASDALTGDFSSATDLKGKIKVLEAIKKELGVFEDPALELEPLLTEAAAAATAGLKRSPSAAIELLIARDDLAGEIKGVEIGEGLGVAEVLREHRDRLPEIVRGMGVGRQRQLYTAAADSFGDDWVKVLLGCMESAGARAIGEITKFLGEAGKDKELSEYLLSGLGQRSLGADVLAWICKERKGIAASAFAEPGTASAIIGALERDHLDEGSSRSSRLHDLLLDDKSLMVDLLEGSDMGAVRHFTRRIQATPVFESLNKNSLLARIVKAYGGVEDLISGEREGEAEQGSEGKRGGLIVSWESLNERREKLEEIINKKIPENSKEIAVAREYGDLRENFEFKAAKQQQAVLMRQKAELEAEIATAKGTDFSDADTSIVSIGTVVDFEDKATGQGETVSVLGAWDTDVEKHIVSYLSGMGAALIGKVVGDEIVLPTEVEGVNRDVRITAIRSYVEQGE